MGPMAPIGLTRPSTFKLFAQLKIMGLQQIINLERTTVNKFLLAGEGRRNPPQVDADQAITLAESDGSNLEKQQQ